MIWKIRIMVISIVLLLIILLSGCLINQKEQFEYVVKIENDDGGNYRLIIPIGEHYSKEKPSEDIINRMRRSDEKSTITLVETKYGNGLEIIASGNLDLDAKNSDYKDDPGFFLSMMENETKDYEYTFWVYFESTNVTSLRIQINLKTIFNTGTKFYYETDPEFQTISNIGWQTISISEMEINS